MFTNELVFMFAGFIGIAVCLVAYLQSIAVWRKLGFAIARTKEEKKIALEYRKTSRSNITIWTLYFTYFLFFAFIVLRALNIISKPQVIILCFTFVISLCIVFGLSVVISDRIIRNR